MTVDDDAFVARGRTLMTLGGLEARRFLDLRAAIMLRAIREHETDVAVLAARSAYYYARLIWLTESPDAFVWSVQGKVS